MSALVQICFTHNWSEEALAAGALDWAANVKPTIPGLAWKIFVKDATEKQSCGIYLFESLASANAYAAGEVVQAMKNSPEISDISIRVSEVMEEPSLLAGAPLGSTG